MCGILPLEVEVGRFQGVKRELRLCRVCGKKAVETEYHFLFSCKRLIYTRKKMPKKLRRSIKGLNSPQEKLSTLFREHNLKSFAEYLNVLYEARLQALYRWCPILRLNFGVCGSDCWIGSPVAACRTSTVWLEGGPSGVSACTPGVISTIVIHQILYYIVFIYIS